MKIATSLRITGATLLASLALTPFVDARHEKNLPSETYGMIQVLDVSDLQKRWDKHPLKADCDNAKLEEFFAPMLKDKQVGVVEQKDKDAKKFFDALKKHLTGEVLWAVVNTPKTEKGHLPYDYVVFVDTSADEKLIAELLEDGQLFQEQKYEIPERVYNIQTGKIKPGDVAAAGDDDEGDEKMLSAVIKKITEKYRGVTVHSLENIIGQDDPVNLGGWALVEKTFVYASAPNVLRELIDAVKDGRKDGFADTAQWKRNRGNMGDPDVVAFVNGGLSASALRDYVVKQTADAPPNMFGVNYVQAYDALGLDAMDAIWFAKKLEPEQVSFKSSFSYAEKKGLLSLMTYKPLETTAVPAYIPSGVSTFSVTRFDMAQAWTNFEAVFAKAVPGLKFMLDMQLNNIKAEEGIDVKDGFFQNLGDEMVTVSELGSGEKSDASGMPVGNMLYVLGIKDQAKLEALLATALGKLADSSALFDERDFMEVKIRRFKNPQAGGDAAMAELQAKQMPYFAVHNGRLFIGQGDAKILEKVIAEIKDGKDPASADASVQQAMKLVPKGVVSFTYADVASYVDYVASLFSFMGKMQDKTFVDPAKKPSPDALPWILSGYGEERQNEITSQGVVFRKKK